MKPVFLRGKVRAGAGRPFRIITLHIHLDLCFFVYAWLSRLLALQFRHVRPGPSPLSLTKPWTWKIENGFGNDMALRDLDVKGRLRTLLTV